MSGESSSPNCCYVEAFSICPASYTLATNNNNVDGIEDGTADATVQHDGMNVDVCCINPELFSAEVLVDVGTTWCDIIIE